MHEPLKNCPFCGGMATAKPIDSVPGWHHVTVLHSDCFYKPAQDQMLLNDEHLAAWNRRTPQPVVRESICDKELGDIAKVGAIATDESGKVVIWPVLYRNQMVGRFKRGWREAEKHYGITQKGGSNAE